MNWPPVTVTVDGITQIPFLHSANGSGLMPVHTVEGVEGGQIGTLQPARVQPQRDESISHLSGSEITVG